METQEQTPAEQPAGEQPAPTQPATEQAAKPSTPAQPTTEQAAKPSATAQRFQEAVERLGRLTLSLMQHRDELEDKQRQAEALEAEITQRRLRIEADEREMLRAQGAVSALQPLVQAEAEQQQQQQGETNEE